MKNKKFGYVIGIALLLSILVVSIPQAKANPQFVLAYDFPTPDGNGIAYIQAYLDGDFNGTMYYNSDTNPSDTGINPLDIEAGVNITLAVMGWVNGTHTGISSIEEGKLIMRHSVSVTSNNGTVIFSQQNFTFVIGADDYAPMYFYRYDVVLDFVPDYGEIYTATVVFELFY